MNLTNIKLWIFNIVGFFAANPVFLAVIGGIIVLLIVFGAVSRSCEEKAKQKDAQNKEEILKDKGKLEILEEKEQEILKDEKRASENSIQAESNFNRIIRRDSSDFNSNFNSAKRKFCESFPTDSKCR